MLSILQPNQQSPNLSAFEALWGISSFNTTPMTPPGTKCDVHIKPSKYSSWGYHTTKAWYLGPKLNKPVLQSPCWRHQSHLNIKYHHIQWSHHPPIPNIQHWLNSQGHQAPPKCCRPCMTISTTQWTYRNWQPLSASLPHPWCSVHFYIKETNNATVPATNHAYEDTVAALSMESLEDIPPHAAIAHQPCARIIFLHHELTLTNYILSALNQHNHAPLSLPGFVSTITDEVTGKSCEYWGVIKLDN